MDEMMKYVMETYGNLIQTTKDGRKIVYNEMIDCLELTPQEKAFIRLTFKTYEVEIVDRKKEMITKETRPERVSDYNYGEVQSDGLESVDKPVLAKIEYEGEQLVFADYDELDEFIINEFIPNTVRMKVNHSRNSKANSGKMYPSITLNDIVKLKLSEKEVEHVVRLLDREGIRIGGVSQDLDSEFMNYDYIRTYATKRYEKPLSPIEEKEKFIEYYQTNDPLLREELIIRNLRLVPYVAWKLALRHNLDQEELESHGYEALVCAVDRFDPYMNAKFSTYAIPCIKHHLGRVIPKLKNIPQNLYYDFKSVCYIVEREWGKKFDGDPEMLEEILDTMYSMGMINSQIKRQELYAYFLNKNGLSLEQMQEDGINLTTVGSSNLDGKLFYHMLQDMLEKALCNLSIREKTIIELRYGLKDGHQRTLGELSKEFHLSKERIRQIELKALRKLRHPIYYRGINITLDAIDQDKNESNDSVIFYDESEDIDSKKI